MKNSDIGFGIIGLGWPGVSHSRALARVPGTRIAAGCDLGAERREKYVAEFAPDNIYHGYEEMLEDPAVDAVVVSLPNFLHFPATLAALQAGKHVLCEKPPTLNLAEIETLRDEVKSRGLTYSFGRQFRFGASMMAARRAIIEGRLGRIYYGKAQWVRLRGIPTGIGGWFTDKARSGGGAMIDIGIHALDAAWFLAGCPKPLSVSAQTGAFFAGTVPDVARFDVDDSGFAFIRFEGGLTITLEVAWAMNLADEAAGLEAPGKSEIMNTILYGDAATLQITPPMLLSANPADPKELLKTPLAIEEEGEEPFAQAGCFTRQMADFAGAIRSGTPPLNNIDQAVDLMKMLMGIYESGAAAKEVYF